MANDKSAWRKRRQDKEASYFDLRAVRRLTTTAKLNRRLPKDD